MKEAEEKERKMKQKFLFEEVMEKNYDIEVFEKFLNWKKEGGDDIDNWEMTGLEEAVKEFKKHFPHAINFDIVAERSTNIYRKSAEDSMEKSVTVVDLMNNKLQIFSEFSNGKGVRRTVNDLVWAIGTFGEENPQVGTVGEGIERLFRDAQSNELVRENILKLRRIVDKFKGPSGEEEKEVDLLTEEVDLKGMALDDAVMKEVRRRR